MRDKKYRLFNTIDKVMIDKPNSIRIVDGVMTCDDEDILIEYTGLKDKNGVEIYEGDILQTYYGKEVDGRPFVAQYIGGAFVQQYPNGSKRNISAIEYTPAVIGNIHENPDLLNGNRG